MSPTGHKRWRAAVRFPRVSGDEPESAELTLGYT